MQLAQIRARLTAWPTQAVSPVFKPDARAAAVLIPLIAHPTGLTVLFTQRTDHLHHHPGQISFPGGRLESIDKSPEAAALRETKEEIGLDAKHIELIARLPQYLTRTGFDITPIVGVVSTPFELVLDSFEVAEAFEVPLSFFLEAKNWQQGVMIRDGVEHPYLSVQFGKRNIWGVTAGILERFSKCLIGY